MNWLRRGAHGAASLAPASSRSSFGNRPSVAALPLWHLHLHEITQESNDSALHSARLAAGGLARAGAGREPSLFHRGTNHQSPCSARRQWLGSARLQSPRSPSSSRHVASLPACRDGWHSPCIHGGGRVEDSNAAQWCGRYGGTSDGCRPRSRRGRSKSWTKLDNERTPGEGRPDFTEEDPKWQSTCIFF